MSRAEQLPAGKNGFEQVLKGLGKNNPEMVEYCTNILLQTLQMDTSGNCVSLLLAQAMVPRRSTEHRVRILDVILRHGAPLNPNDFLDVFTLSNQADPIVAQKAAQLIVDLRPDKFKNTAEDFSPTIENNPSAENSCSLSKR